VRVLEYDPDRGAVLLERLGGQLHESGLPVRAQIETICGVLDEVWAVDATSLALPTTVDKATEAIEAIDAGRAHLGRLADKALALAGGYRFVDPDGLVGEREYDLSFSMREFSDELMAGDNAIWKWGIVERVTNALLFIDEGDNDAAATCLTIAERWTR
jgi:streptomycin 6-kinase